MAGLIITGACSSIVCCVLFVILVVLFVFGVEECGSFDAVWLVSMW